MGLKPKEDREELNEKKFTLIELVLTLKLKFIKNIQ